MKSLNDLYSIPYNTLSFKNIQLDVDKNGLDHPLTKEQSDEYYNILATIFQKGIERKNYSDAIISTFELLLTDNKDYQTYVMYSLKIAGLFLPEFGAVTAFTGLFFKLLNKGKQKAPELTPNSIFEAIKPKIADMISDALIKNDTDYLDKLIKGLSGYLSQYKNTIEDINNLGGFQKADSGALEKYVSQTNILDSFFTLNLPQFADMTDPSNDKEYNARHSMIGLPYYCMLASIHLMLSRDTILYGPLWVPETYTPDRIKLMKADLKRNINNYTKVVIQTFKNSVKNYGYIVGEDLPTDPIQLQKLLNLIGGMTTRCLDIARMFPIFDPDVYPPNTNHIDFELTRQLLLPMFVDTTNDNDRSDVYRAISKKPIKDISNWKAYKNGVVNVLSNEELIQIDREGEQTSFPNTVIPTQIKLTYRNGEQLTYGYPANKIRDKEGDKLYPNGSIFQDSVKLTSNEPGTAISTNIYNNFLDGRGLGILSDSQQVNLNNLETSTILPTIPQHTIVDLYPNTFADGPTDDPQRHGYVVNNPFNAGIGVSKPITPESNTIGDTINDSNILYKGFPVEKALDPIGGSVSGGTLVAEYINGACCIKLSPNGSIRLNINNITELDYTIRLRYALKTDASMDGKISFTISNSETDNYTLPRIADNDLNYVEGENGNYVIQTLKERIKLFIGPTNVQINNQGIEDIFLDRIEIFPVFPPVTDTINQEFDGYTDIILWSGNASTIAFLDIQDTMNTGKLLDNLNTKIRFLSQGMPQSEQDVVMGRHFYKEVPATFDQIQLYFPNKFFDNTVKPFDIQVSGTIYGNQPVDPIDPDIPIDIVPLAPMTFSTSETLLWTAHDKIGYSAVLNFHSDSNEYEDAFDDSQPIANFKLKGVSQYKQSILTDNDIKTPTIPNGFDQITVSLSTGDPISINGGCSVYGSKIQNEVFTNIKDLNNITALVHSLFTSSAQTKLTALTNSYQINQAEMKINSLSTTIFGKEKKVLRTLLNKAKQLIKNRNLLVGGNFENLTNWLFGPKVRIVDNNDLFYTQYLLLPPPKGFPSYAYQKIDETKLKQNTRYTISGFIGQSTELNIVVSRYGKEIDKILHVPYKEALPITSDSNSNCCKANLCQCKLYDGSTPHSNFFNYSIDVGSLNTTLNPGIEFGLRIMNSNGLATISNLEIIEDRPLTEKEIKFIQRKEQKWQKELKNELTKIDIILQPIIDKINNLFVNADWNNTILPHITYKDLQTVVLPKLPNMRHWLMSDRPGNFYNLYQKLQTALKNAYDFLSAQNILSNGNLNYEKLEDLQKDWTVEGDLQTITLENNQHLIKFLNGNTSISRLITISNFTEDKMYKLRVYAKGKGIITIDPKDSNENNIVTMSFNTNSFIFQEKSFYLEEASFILHIQAVANEFSVYSVEIIEVSEKTN